MLPDKFKVKRMRITEILRRIWLFSANKIKSSESFSNQPTQLIIASHNCHTSPKRGVGDGKTKIGCPI